MKKEDKFYFIILLSVIIARIVAFLNPRHLIINNLVVHHFLIGILLILIAILFFRKNNNFKLIFTGIGLGFVIDELGFLILGGGDFPQYWALYSVISTGFLLIVAYLFKGKIYKTIFK